MIQSSLSPHVNPVNETEPGYGQIFAVLIRRLPWFLVVFVTCIAGAALITKRTPPTYKSSMQLLVEPNYKQNTQEATTGGNFTDSNVVVDTATQLNIMQSSALIQKAVDKLKAEYPDITTDQIQRALVLNQLRTKEDNLATNIFQADYTDTDPNKTERVLNAIRQVYLEYNRQQQAERLRKGLRVVQQQLRDTLEEVNKAEANLQRFRRNQNLIDPEAQAKSLEDNLNAILQDRRTTRAQYEEARARYASLQQQLQSTPQNALVEARLSQSTRYQGLLNEIQKTQLALAQERLRFTDQAPSVIKLVEQLQKQKELLQQEAGNTLGGQQSNVNSPGGGLLNQGQQSQIDLTLASQLVETQTNLLALAARDQSLANKEQQVRDELKSFPAKLAEYSRLQPQIQLGRERLQELLKAQQQLQQELDKGGFNWEVVEPPRKGIFMGPDLKQNLMLGAVVGLMLGGVAAFIRDASDDSVHTTAELERQTSLPVLGSTPKLPPAKTRESVFKLPFGKPEVLAPWTIQVLQSPPRWESLDLIYKNIELLNSVSTFKSLMVTSALPDEGKSGLALGLAMSAARLHKRVLLIDANLRSPNLHKQLNLPNEQGLSTLLVSESTLPNQISIPSAGSSYIDILTAGPAPADPANLLSSPRMEELMAAFEESYDLVIVDAPPVLGLVDALLTASACRSVIMVASIGRVTRTQLAQATAMLSRLNLIGVVANGVSDSGSTYVPYAKQHSLALQRAMEE
ncbi:MAG: polysaccharide biosynthesis tyrosine autokinase [Pelatocladus maniniholoensis HA4357-MV3]|uniref:Polysaccharide biosynthesis tyrosine autokinase n=1 Tax=Pelatocladus maniniholoensis HA4357-MV3 TaxID=1117104 RepID=A0A9E3LTZ5_9NOST|nr:polysaccharide biosynthesis tyrosine autokinase [Pelatocladus maniniholoensis HA4357-MV3]BAZ69190.1 lipopolysaccharide biosynthesis protein [Fischerella sp. NIES-4106]